MRTTTGRLAMLFATASMGGCSLLVSLDGFIGGESADAADGGAGEGRAAVRGDAEADADADADAAADLRSCAAPGLIAYYKLDEGGGLLAANCVGAGSHPGQASAAAWEGPIEGLSALSLDGGNRLDLASSVPLLEDVGNRDLTITAAVIARPRAISRLGRIVSKCGASPTGCNEGLELLIEGRSDGGAPGLTLRVPTLGVLSEAIQDPSAFPPDVITRVAATYDSAGMPMGRVYRDGDKVAEGPFNSPRRNNFGSVSIGMKGDTSNGNGFVGIIDEVRLWNRVLSDCEIRVLAGKTCP